MELLSAKKVKAKFKNIDKAIDKYEDYAKEIERIEKEKGKGMGFTKSRKNGAIREAEKLFDEAEKEVKDFLGQKTFDNAEVNNNLKIVIDSSGKCSVYTHQFASALINAFKSAANGLELALKNFKSKSRDENKNKRKVELVHGMYDKFIAGTVDKAITDLRAVAIPLKGYYNAKNDMKDDEKIKSYNGKFVWVIKGHQWPNYKEAKGYFSVESGSTGKCVFVINKNNEVIKGLELDIEAWPKFLEHEKDELLFSIKKEVEDPKKFSIKDGVLKML